MSKLIVTEDFWQLFPNATIGVIVVKNIDNSIVEPQYYQKLLDDAALVAKKFCQQEPFSENEVVRRWRNIYSLFSTKKGARSSIEAMLKRVSQQREFTPINPVVDLYNSISLKYAIPFGAEDIGKITGNLQLTMANGGEEFYPLGENSNQPALAGEILYKDDAGAVCRCLNWREAQRTMITEQTSDVVFCSEFINDNRNEQFKQAMQELQQLIQQKFTQ